MMERIAQITDLHLDEAFPFKDLTSARKRFDAVLKDIERENITQVICTGDIGEKEGISYFFEKLKDKNLSLTLGNHDSFTEISKYYDLGANYHAQKIYHSRLTEYHKFIFLDSSAGSVDQEQLNWLDRELVSPLNILVFIHHPILGLDLKVDEIGKLKDRGKIVSLLTKHTNEITIFCGHYHLESFQAHKNIKQFITPAVAFQIKKDINTIAIDTTTTAYRIIEVEKNKLSSKVSYAD